MKAARSASRLRRLLVVTLIAAGGAPFTAPGISAQSPCPTGEVDCLVAELTAWLEGPARRTGRLGSRSHERRAARRILELDPAQPLGLEIAAKWELDEVLWSRFNHARFGTLYFARRAAEAAERAKRFLMAWQAVDPAAAGPYRELARLCLHTGDWSALVPVAEAMRAMRRDDPAAELYLGMARHAMGDERAAALAFERALSLMDDSTRTGYLDVSGIVRPAEADEAGGQDSGAWFATRDPRLLTPENERRSAHLARVAMADLLYGDAGSPGWKTVEGGLIVRYGLPRQPEKALAPYGVLPDALSADPLAGSLKSWALDGTGTVLVLESPYRDGRFRLYSPSAKEQYDAGGRAADYEILAHDLFLTTPEHFEYETPGRRVRFPLVVSVLRGDGGRARVFAAFGLPIAPDAPDEGDLDARLEAGFFLTGRSGVVATSRRTIVGLAAGGRYDVEDERLWTGVLETSARSGAFATSMEFELADRTVVGFESGAIDVPTFAEDSLTMSDLVVARLVEDGDASGPEVAFRASGLTVYPAAWHVFESGRPVYLFFEVYGLGTDVPGGSRYGVEALLERSDRPTFLGRIWQALGGRGRSNSVSVAFDASVPGPDDGRYLILDTSALEPGGYFVSVRITDRVSGRTSERGRPLTLVAPAPSK